MAQLAAETETKSNDVEPFNNGLEIEVLSKGDGKTFPKKNDLVSVRYRGYFHGGNKHGFEFDTSWDSPYQFKVGDEIKGWNKGLKRMSLGERSILKIPHRLAYGMEGSPPEIGPYQDLQYEIELLEVIGKLPSGVDVHIISGEDIESDQPQKGDKVMISYKGTFWGGPNHGKTFEKTDGKFHEYAIGVGKLIRGWEEGIPQMRFGQTAIFMISADFAYGKKGAKGMPPIPPNQDLRFKVTLKERE